MAFDVMPLYPRATNETATDTGGESSKNSNSDSGGSDKGSKNCKPTTVTETQTVNTCAGECYPTISTTTKTVNTCSAEGYHTVSTKTITTCNGYPTVS